ncbi:hypothetical protein CHS0354_007516 [Potamilus streckersoni]|uniref:BZIP domain-containing protein n=1 Tax=Potamilus streckersoni TaxID=2493646 RepID=A0AAE0T8S4_9BIVA|nr:hypothetical protein CHS0354_007516 [Potamilus streckersoni]
MFNGKDISESICTCCSPLSDDIFNVQDQTLERAITDSLLQGKITPLLKQELNLKIQCKRLLEGKREIVIQHEQPKTYQMSEDEILKRNRRLQQNRASANRSRGRLKNREEELMTVVNLSELNRRQLERKREGYVKYKNEIKAILLNHINECKNIQWKHSAESTLRSLGLL